MKTCEACADCVAYKNCSARRRYDGNTELCFWFIDRKIRNIPDSNFIADIRKVLFSNVYPEYVVDKLQEMFKAREGDNL